MSTTPNRTDGLCDCGSGKPMADCHGPIVDAPLLRKIPVAQEIYVREWGVNAAHYQTQGLYDDLAGELLDSTDVRRLVDIGCGLGQGLEALVPHVLAGDAGLVVGVDENPGCIAGSATRLGVGPEGVCNNRIRSRKTLRDWVDVEVSPSRLRLDGRVVLVNVDMMVADPSFDRWLDAGGPLDAVTLWFSGIHKGRAWTKVARRIGARSDRDLREALEDKVMEFAVRRLRPGGVLQIVRRGAGDAETERRGWEAEVVSALPEWPFDLVDISARQYEEPDDPNAITVSSRAFDAEALPNFALSLILRRRSGGG